jgi:L-iditol 2-dehydrogenase
MQAAVLTGPKQFALVDLPVPTPGPGEVLIRVTAVGLCGSDLHSYREANIGGTAVPAGYILGHEFGGIVAALGAGVTDRRIGQRVAVDPAVPCGHCEYCINGRMNLCQAMVFTGHPPHLGALREFMAHPAHATTPIPDSISDADAALLEPLGVALHALDLAQVQLGESVAIQGCGSIGLMMVQLARAAGAGRILALDVLQERLDLACRLGATEAELVYPGQAIEAEPVHVVLEATGSSEAMQRSVDIARVGGRIVYVGIPDGDRVAFRASTARRKELLVQFARRMKHMYPRTIALVDTGVVDLKPIHTHTLPLREISRAFALFSERQDHAIKVIVNPSLSE